MITKQEVAKLRQLHDIEKKAYQATRDNTSMLLYDKWVEAREELERFLKTITKPD